MFDIFYTLLGYVCAVGKGVHASSNQMLRKQYCEDKKYNLDRQRELERMVYSADPEVKKEFDRMVGRTVNSKNEFDVKLAVREISIREGWGYQDISEMYSDPAYVKLIDGKWDEHIRTPHQYYGKALTGSAKALDMIAETDRRKTWLERCPHGKDVDLFPMDFESEQQYDEAVKVEFLFSKYAIYRDAKSKKYAAHLIQTIEGKWEQYQRTWSGVELAITMCDWVYHTLGTSGILGDYLKVIREKCEMEGIDWDKVIAASDGDFI